MDTSAVTISRRGTQPTRLVPASIASALVGLLAGAGAVLVLDPSAPESASVQQHSGIPDAAITDCTYRPGVYAC